MGFRVSVPHTERPGSIMTPVPRQLIQLIPKTPTTIETTIKSTITNRATIKATFTIEATIQTTIVARVVIVVV